MLTPAAAELAVVVREIESHAAESGWDRSAQLFALVPTADLAAAEPELAQAMGLDAASAGYTPIDQEVSADLDFEQMLTTMSWPPEVSGCAAVVERLVLPTSAHEAIPEDREAAATYAAEHPDRQELRMVAAALRDGTTYCALRFRTHDDPDSVVAGPDLVPALLELLQATLTEEDE